LNSLSASCGHDAKCHKLDDGPCARSIFNSLAERVSLTTTSTEMCIGPGRREELASGIYLTANEL